MESRELLDMITKESSWEEVIEYIVAEEGMDPWDIDIIKLSDAFMRYLGDIKDLDFRVPARLIIISAILIRMKVDILMYEEQEQKEEQQKEDVIGIDLSKIPDLQAPIVRQPKRKVTLDELIGALDKAFRTQKKRETREYRAREIVEEVISTEDDFNISEKIDEIYNKIDDVLKEITEGNLKFSSLVTKWTKKDVVETFLPVLHLTTEGKISINQEEPFSEIYIKMRIDDGSEEGEN